MKANDIYSLPEEGAPCTNCEGQLNENEFVWAFMDDQFGRWCFDCASSTFEEADPRVREPDSA